jgi:hypothetical protein
MYTVQTAASLKKNKLKRRLRELIPKTGSGERLTNGQREVRGGPLPYNMKSSDNYLPIFYADG